MEIIQDENDNNEQCGDGDGDCRNDDDDDGKNNDNKEGDIDDGDDNPHHLDLHDHLHNWFPVDGSDSVSLLGCLGAVQRPLHMGDGRTA